MVWSWGVRIRGALVNGLLILTIFQDILKRCRQPPLVADEATFDGQSGPY